MLNRLSTLILLGISTFDADNLQLKDNAVISGRILAEKPDQVAIDVGYTVLVVPRTNIEKITPAETAKKEAPPVESTNVTPPASEKVKAGFFRGGIADAKDRTVREMVAQL